MHSTSRRGALLVATLAAALVAAALPGCDNPACIYGGNCTVGGGGGGGGGGGSAQAVFPETGEWIASASPTVEAVFPSGTGASAQSPVVIRFSESMAPASVQGAFELLQTGQIETTLPLTGGALIGDGRLLVLAPPPLLAGTTYEVRTVAGADANDLTGQKLVEPVSGRLATFTVASAPGPAPRLLTSWPPDGTGGQSELTQVVVVFDRLMDPTSVDGASFDVRVGGADPAFDPEPEVLGLGEFGGESLSEPRVYTWRSVDADGAPVALGAPGDAVAVTLSAEIADAGGTPLAQTSFGFDLSPFPIPSSAAILSDPTDAIGIDNLLGPMDLMVELLLSEETVQGDQIGAFLFGTAPVGDGVIALERQLWIAAGKTRKVMDREDLELVSSSAPLQAVFADGDVALAFQLRRGAAATPVRLLDVDPLFAGVQDPVLDTVRPQLTGLTADGDELVLYRSDLRDLAVIGRADEQLRSVEVAAVVGGKTLTNGAFPPVAGSDAAGLFVAAPVPLGLLAEDDLPAEISVRVYDRALNAAPDLTLDFVQLGASGPGAALAGQDLRVTVFDQSTQAPLAGALVFTHQDDGGVVIPIATATTDVNGRALLASAAAGETIASVDAGAGYNLFTFHGVPTERLDVPLTPGALTPAIVTAALLSQDDELVDNESRFADTRIPPPSDPLLAGEACEYDGFLGLTTCLVEPFAVLPRRIGAHSFHSIAPPANETLWGAGTFLRAFAFSFPRPALPPGGTEGVTLNLAAVLADLEVEERAIDAPLQVLDASAVTGLDPGSLDGDPRVRIEALVPGVAAPAVVGLGAAFDQGGALWRVRAAYPGAVDGVSDVEGDALGRLVLDGTVDGDLFLGAELRDALLNRACARPRLSAASGTLRPPGVPVLSAPAGTTGGPSFDLEFDDVLFDASAQPGIYRATVVDQDLRSWVLWRLDPPDADPPDPVRVHVPDIALGGGAPLADGPLAISVSAFAWGFDTAAFLWSDMGRLSERYAHSTVFPVVQD